MLSLSDNSTCARGLPPQRRCPSQPALLRLASRKFPRTDATDDKLIPSIRDSSKCHQVPLWGRGSRTGSPRSQAPAPFRRPGFGQRHKPAQLARPGHTQPAKERQRDRHRAPVAEQPIQRCKAGTGWPAHPAPSHSPGPPRPRHPFAAALEGQPIHALAQTPNALARVFPFRGTGALELGAHRAVRTPQWAAVPTLEPQGPLCVQPVGLSGPAPQASILRSVTEPGPITLHVQPFGSPPDQPSGWARCTGGRWVGHKAASRRSVPSGRT